MTLQGQRSILTPFVVALAMSLTSCAAPDSPDRESVTSTSYAPQNRPDVRGVNGAVSAGHPLAAQAGLAVLQDGGTATDAIIAMAGVLAVVRPHMNGVGGDAFAIFFDGATGDVTADGGIVMAHNTWSSYADAQFCNIIVDIVPDNGHRILMQSWGPLIYSGTDFFITSAGPSSWFG